MTIVALNLIGVKPPAVRRASTAIQHTDHQVPPKTK
jgi:hypothetical protein